MTDKLPWTRYKYSATSGDTKVVGLVQLHYYPTPSQISRVCLERVCREVEEANESWDPFNCTLIVIRERDAYPPSVDEMFIKNINTALKDLYE